MRRVLKESFGFDRVVGRLTLLIRQAADPSTSASNREALSEYALLKLHDAWAFRCRQIVLRTAAGGITDAHNRIIPRATHLPLGVNPLQYLRSNWGRSTMGRSWEPDWFIPGATIRAAGLLGNANLASISAGIGASFAAAEVRTVRNLIAHSLPNTWRRFRDLSIPRHGVVPPQQVILFVDIVSGTNQFSRWAADMRASIIGACS